MPGEGDPLYPWPYSEGLRLDEAMQRLTIIATGLYGQPLPNPDGAPLRLVVPWKYGFKSIKAIVKIELTEQQPADDVEHDFAAGIRLLSPTSTPRWITRAGARPVNGASVN